MKKGFLMLYLVVSSVLTGQTQDQVRIKEIYDTALSNGKAYRWLGHLTKRIGGRLSGSVQADQAVEYTKSLMDSLNLDKVWLQPVMVPKWVRGIPEYAYLENTPGLTTTVPICALGGSVATPQMGVKTEVIEVQGLEDLATLGRKRIQGKIVFYNRPMDPKSINTFEAYSGAVDQRYSGAAEAAKYGAVGIIVRSMTLKNDDVPHTGVMSYGDTPPAQWIPAAAISTNGADLLSVGLKLNPDLKFYFKLNCKQLDDVQSYNVIGEIKGSQYPGKVMVVGAHLDSWDLGAGAHDDGAGCVQSMEVLRLFKLIGYRPKHTIRVVLYANEENGVRGGTEYAKVARERNEDHVFALESDSGGFTPRGFTLQCGQADFDTVLGWKPLFQPYMVDTFVKGHGGADIGPLEDGKIVLAGLLPDTQRYFDYHHAETDVFENVNKRELELGAATMASLVYLFDMHGTAAGR